MDWDYWVRGWVRGIGSGDCGVSGGIRCVLGSAFFGNIIWMEYMGGGRIERLNNG